MTRLIRHMVRHSTLLSTRKSANCISIRSFVSVGRYLQDKFDPNQIVINSSKSSLETYEEKTEDEGEDISKWVEWLKTLSDVDMEKELLRLKMEIGSLHFKGHHDSALTSALKLRAAVMDTIGKDSPIYASCVNNIALMNKLLGHNDAALDGYIEALQVYADTVGNQHKSYASTLSNIGILYRTMSNDKKGMERLQLLERAEEALSDSEKIHTTLVDTAMRHREEDGGIAVKTSVSEHHRDRLLATMNLSLVRHRQSLQEVTDNEKHGRQDGKLAAEKLVIVSNVQKAEEAEAQLKEAIEVCTRQFGEMDSLAGTMISNYGYILKSVGRYEEALPLYRKALDIRITTLGESNPDTIVSMHNLAELYHNMGPKYEKQAIDLQQDILDIMERVGESKDSRQQQQKVQQQVQKQEANETVEEKGKLEPSKPVVTYATRRKKK